MAKLTLSLFVFVAITQLVCGTSLRFKRQLEREDSPLNTDVVVVDKNGDKPTNTRYDIVNGFDKPNKTVAEEEVDLDIDDDGHFTFGGRIPGYQGFHGSFNRLFGMLNKHFDEMFHRMSSSFGRQPFGSRFRPILPAFGMDGDSTELDSDSTDVASLPDNCNTTKTELVTLHGQQFLKKTTVIKKGGPNSQIHITSISYRPVDESENVEPGSENKPEAPEKTPNPVEPSEPSEPSMPSEPTEEEGVKKETEFDI
jgi:hypothetical protein